MGANVTESPKQTVLNLCYAQLELDYGYIRAITPMYTTYELTPAVNFGRVRWLFRCFFLLAHGLNKHHPGLERQRHTRHHDQKTLADEEYSNGRQEVRGKWGVAFHAYTTTQDSPRTLHAKKENLTTLH